MPTIVMKGHVLLFLTFLFLYSCNKDDDKNNNTPKIGLIGTWTLIEVYNDPGGGGSFIAVDSRKKITFHSNGTITSNGTLCNNSPFAGNPTSGTYSASDSIYNSADCFYPDYDYAFEQINNILIIHYPCFEPCRAKYEKK